MLAILESRAKHGIFTVFILLVAYKMEMTTPFKGINMQSKASLVGKHSQSVSQVFS